jgi:hypothetical protein
MKVDLQASVATVYVNLPQKNIIIEGLNYPESIAFLGHF